MSNEDILKCTKTAATDAQKNHVRKGYIKTISIQTNAFKLFANADRNPNRTTKVTANAITAFVEIPDGEDKLHFFDYVNTNAAPTQHKPNPLPFPQIVTDAEMRKAQADNFYDKV